jgi:hypothetical protein
MITTHYIEEARKADRVRILKSFFKQFKLFNAIFYLNSGWFN